MRYKEDNDQNSDIEEEQAGGREMILCTKDCLGSMIELAPGRGELRYDIKTRSGEITASERGQTVVRTGGTSCILSVYGGSDTTQWRVQHHYLIKRGSRKEDNSILFYMKCVIGRSGRDLISIGLIDIQLDKQPTDESLCAPDPTGEIEKRC